jgi:AmmeMemoRadiSam system protein B
VIRKPAVAGLFYPDDPSELARTVDGLLELAGAEPLARLRALVAPHAGYVYSGPVAATAFAHVPSAAQVLLLGPSHFVPLDGLAVSGADAWTTPLGDVAIADDLREAALGAGAAVDDRPHARDHALEVELPFLQRACREGLEILPMAVGRASAEEVARLIEELDALVVVSTDLSHYHDAETARRLDRETADAVVRRETSAIRADGACGIHALRGLVEHARRFDLEVELLDLRTSADTAGTPESVVGYGAFAITQGRVA